MVAANAWLWIEMNSRRARGDCYIIYSVSVLKRVYPVCCMVKIIWCNNPHSRCRALLGGDLWIISNIILACCAGFSDRQWSDYISRRNLLERSSNVELEDKLPKKIFKQTHTAIPEVSSYSGALDSSYWDHWVKRTYEQLTPARGWVCPNKLWDLAASLKYRDFHGRLGRAMERLSRGADIGCEGDGRLPTSKPNSESASTYGVRVADSLQSWIMDGLCFGPLLPNEMPWATYTINPITVKLKPNGKARICINMSSPYNRGSDPPGTPASVNSGIDITKFPVMMSSIHSFLYSLMLVGCPANMC